MRDNVALSATSRKPKGYTAWRDSVTVCGMDTASNAVEQRVAAEARAELARRRISGRQIGAMLGWTPAYVSRRLTGQIPFSLSDLEALAMALDIPISEFITRREWFTRRSLVAAIASVLDFTRPLRGQCERGAPQTAYAGGAPRPVLGLAA